MIATTVIALALGLVMARLRQLASQREAVETLSKYGEFWCGRKADGLTRFFQGEFQWSVPVTFSVLVPIQADSRVRDSGDIVFDTRSAEAVAPDDLVALLGRLPRLDQLELPAGTPPETVAAIREAIPKECRLKVPKEWKRSRPYEVLLYVEPEGRKI
jgi:hypothetical protein